MKKNSHPTTKVLVKPKIPTAKRDLECKASPWLEDYLDLQGMKMKPITQGFIERLSQELLDWSLKDTSVIFRDFVDDKYIPLDAYYRWADKYPELKAAHALAKGRIGSRREKGALARKYDSSFIANSMPMYDNEWKEFLAWKTSLKDQSNSGNVTINLPNITASPVLGE